MRGLYNLNLFHSGIENEPKYTRAQKIIDDVFSATALFIPSHPSLLQLKCEL
jgi:hypothetical protein